jgi:hypothetical protein
MTAGLCTLLYNLLANLPPCGMCLGMCCGMLGIGTFCSTLDQCFLFPCIFWDMIDNML